MDTKAKGWGRALVGVLSVTGLVSACGSVPGGEPPEALGRTTEAVSQCGVRPPDMLCETAVCSSGQWVWTPLPQGTGCGEAGHCDGAGGCVGDCTAANRAAVTGTLVATPATVSVGLSTTLRWSLDIYSGCLSEDASLLKLDGVSIGGQGAAGSVKLAPTANQSHTLTYGSRVLATAPVNVTTAPALSIDGNSPDWAAAFVEAAGAGGQTIVIRGDVRLDLSGYDSIYVRQGTSIFGDRTRPGANPTLFTTTFPSRLLWLETDESNPVQYGDNVRISGLRIQGAESDDPFSAVGQPESDGLSLYSPNNVEIDHCEIDHWRGNGVNVHDIHNRLDKDHIPAIKVHDNFIHHNQHPTHDSTIIPGGGHGAGYGVQSADGAYVDIEQNVFDFNRHSIAGDGSDQSGYRAYKNLVLPHGGVNSREPLLGVVYTHALDMHGQNSCGVSDHNCGPAGEYMDIEWNTVLYQSAASVHLRGTPSIGMFVENNVFALSDRDSAIEENELGMYDQANLFGVDALSIPNIIGYDEGGLPIFGPPITEVRQCDFDGDGAPDNFLATGVTWWFTSSRSDGRWQYLAQSPTHAAALTLRDVTGDGYCDVSGDPAHAVVYSGAVFTAPQTIPVVCASNQGAACGACGGVVQCDGTCSIPTPPNVNASCGACGGHVLCDGTCSVATPPGTGAACGSCGGTVQCNGACSVATPGNFGAACGSCGGYVQCDGTCSVATPSNLSYGCGGCGGSIQCDGTCSVYTPWNLGAPCGNHGHITCEGTCQVYVP